MLKSAGLAVILLAAMAIAPPSAARDPAAAPVAGIDRETITPDPAVRRGVLANGLRYQVMRNVNPAGAVSLRFGVDVGSYEESDLERGVAHFVEHMAFRSTRSYPEGSPDRAFAQMGVAFGRDQNAATSLFATTYQLDLPRPDPQQLAAGFAWLRDVADGVIFTDTAVNRERGVVLAEKEARNNPGVLVQDAIGRFQAPRQRSFNRSPIGTRETLNALRATDLQAFYQRWYRPEHAVVTVVGDLPVEALETLVRDAFASWTAKGPAPVRAALAGPDLQRPAQAMTVADATLPTAISACRLRPGASPTLTTVSQLRGALTSQIWQTILNQRLAERVAAGDAHLLGAVMIGGDARDLATTCLITLPTGEAWEASLQSTQAELRRFAEHGPTELEVEKTVELLRARLRGSISEAGSRLSSDLANGLLNRALSRQTTASPADSLYAFDLAVEDLTPADVQARFAQDWSGSPPLLALVAPKVPKDEALLAAWTRNDLAAIAPRYADRVTATWAYETFGTPGKVVERTVIAEPGFVRLRFANGLIVNFKQTQLERNKVEVRLHFGAGRREIDDRLYVAAEMGTGMLMVGGLGRHSFEDIQAMFAAKSAWAFDIDMGSSSFQIRNTTLAESLDSELQILAAYLTDPGFRASLDERIQASIDYVYRAYRSDPATVLSSAIGETVSPRSPTNIPSRESLAALSSAVFATTLRPVLTGAPIELTIVGDIDEATAIQTAAATFGALPPRPTGDRNRGDTQFVRYPDGPVARIRTTHEGPADKAAASVLWPLYVASPERRSEEYALKLLAAVFDSALRQRVREDMGKTYAPSVDTITPDHADQGVLVVNLEAEPADVEALIAETRTVARRLEAGEITQELLEAERRPMLAAARSRRDTNGWWASALSGSARDRAILDELLLYEPLMAAVSLEDVKAAAARWLKREPIVAVAQPSPTAAGAAP